MVVPGNPDIPRFPITVSIPMSSIKEVTDKNFRRAILWSVLMVIGIPMIVYGAIGISKNPLWAIMMAVGILFVVGGFYGTPISWIRYADKKRMYRVAVAMSQTSDVTIDILSDTIGRTQEETRNDVRTLLRNGWLPGYAFVDQEDRVKRVDKLDIHHAECTYCGAFFEFKGTEAKCPYCGRWFDGQPID